MVDVLLRRLLALVGVLLAVSLLTFLLLNLLPGDPATNILGTAGATPHALARVRAQLHLNAPIWSRYLHWLWNALHGNLGESYLTHQSVAQLIAQRLPVTFELIIYSQILALAVAIPLGIYSAYRAGRVADTVASGVTFGMLALPSFVAGVLLIYLFAVETHLFPATGYTSLTANPLENLRSLFLPSLTLALGSVALYSRVLRSEMISTLSEEYIKVARSKGLSNRWILMRHAFRPSTFSLLTLAGISIGSLISGALIVESIFAIPGLGSLTVSAIETRDYLLVQGCVLVIAVAFVLTIFLLDLLYPLIDPRTRQASWNH